MNNKNTKETIEEHISILEKSIKDMLDLDKRLTSFKLSERKEYSNQIKELFEQLVSRNYIKIENKDLNALCEEDLDELDKIGYFSDRSKKSTEPSTFQQGFYLIKSQKTALILGCALYLMIFENLLTQFDNKLIRRISEDLRNKGGKRANVHNHISAHSKIEILRRFNESNVKFLEELDKDLRNAIGHFDFQIQNKHLIYGKKTLTKKELREKTQKIFWLNHIILLNKGLVIREYWLKKFNQSGK